MKDVGSTTGTYIKITKKIELEEGMIIEIGSFQFIITKIFINLNEHAHDEEDKNWQKSYIVLEIYDSPCDSDRKKHILEEGGSIGRKSSNKIHYKEDLHMSNLHCKITRAHDKFVLEDMGSTNG